MAVVEMMGVSLVGPREEIEPVAAELLSLGNFEPVPLEFAMERRTSAFSGSGGARIATFRSNPYDELLENMRAVWKLIPDEDAPDGDGPSAKAGPRPPSESLCERVCPSFSFDEASKRVKELQGKLTVWRERSEALEEEREKLMAAGAFLDALSAAGRGVERTLKSRYLSITFGRLSAENFKRLEEMASVTPLLVFPAVVEKGYVLAVIFCSRDYHSEAEKLFRTLYLKEYALDEIFEGAGEAMQERLRERLSARSRALRALREAPGNYLEKHRKELETLYCSVFSMQRVYALCRNRGELGGIFVLSGLIPAPTLPKVEATLGRFAPNTLLLTEKDTELERRGRRLPTLLKNNFLAKTFQEIVALYSLPSYDETDPSPLVALSFCLFFGFMFGDVGHGFLLTAGAWLLARKGILKPAFASVIRIAGVAAMLFGFLYGSVFGSEEILPSLWTSPMRGIDHLIRTSLFVGVGFMSLGILINIFALRRKGRVGKMLFDGEGVAGLLFYWTAAIAGALAFTSDKGVPVALSALLGALFLVILFGGTLERLLFGLPEGEEEGAVVHTFSVFHALLSFLSNTASFVRLAAFALNHAGLSAAVFMLSDMVHSLPGGAIFRAAILLLGNAVIVGLEGLIVFIQTLRLEYYEFFSKFYEGGGTPFRPVTWKGGE